MGFVDKMIADGVTYAREREFGIIVLIEAYMKDFGFTDKQIRYYFNVDEDFLGDVLNQLPREEVA